MSDISKQVKQLRKTVINLMGKTCNTDIYSPYSEELLMVKGGKFQPHNIYKIYNHQIDLDYCLLNYTVK